MDDIATHFRIQQFLFLEARLMDEHRYDEWLALWEDDAHYWVPCNADHVDRSRHISLVNEDLAGLQDRVIRLKSNSNYAQKPRSRIAHVVSNIEVEEADKPGEVLVHSALNITVSRKQRIDTVAGRVSHHLRSRPEGLRIHRKKVVLVNNDEVFGNLSFLI